jgi:hypothetical protein
MAFSVSCFWKEPNLNWNRAAEPKNVPEGKSTSIWIFETRQQLSMIPTRPNIKTHPIKTYQKQQTLPQVLNRKLDERHVVPESSWPSMVETTELANHHPTITVSEHVKDISAG